MFVGYRYLQHGWANRKGDQNLLYQTYVIVDGTNLKDMVALTYGCLSGREWDP